MNTKKLLLAGGLALACAIIGLAALPSSTNNLVAFSQVEKRTGGMDVYGKLDKASIRTLRGYNLVAFTLVEEKTGERLAVVYDNAASGLPANFPTASHAKCSGVYDPMKQQFITDKVATKCPSKYKEEDLDATTKSAMERWNAKKAGKDAAAGKAKTSSESSAGY